MRGVGEILAPRLIAEIGDVKRFKKCLKSHKPQDDPVYLFMAKKESEGKAPKVAKKQH